MGLLNSDAASDKDGGGAKAQGKDAAGFQQEFMEFLQKYQVVGLAVAFVIGTAATNFVSATVKDILMPVVSVFMPQGDWRAQVLQIGPVKLMFGDFIGEFIDFAIIALFIFLVVKYIMRGDTAKKV
ncbi:MAG: MscL family protein [Methanoregula sp.]|jgi:large conductance mechanosensitive channel